MKDLRGLEFLLCDCALLWRKLYSKHTHELGLIGLERRIILKLYETPGITQIVLATYLEVESQSLVRMLDRMEIKTLIERKISPEDRRAKGLFLTRSGENLYKKIIVIADKLRPQILRGINKSKLADLEIVLESIKSNLNENL